MWKDVLPNARRVRHEKLGPSHLNATVKENPSLTNDVPCLLPSCVVCGRPNKSADNTPKQSQHQQWSRTCANYPHQQIVRQNELLYFAVDSVSLRGVVHHLCEPMNLELVPGRNFALSRKQNQIEAGHRYQRWSPCRNSVKPCFTRLFAGTKIQPREWLTLLSKTVAPGIN